MLRRESKSIPDSPRGRAGVDSLADDGVVRHGGEVLSTDDVSASSGRDEDVSLGSSLLHGGDLETGHRSLEGVDGVDLSDDDSGSVGTERLGALWRRTGSDLVLRMELDSTYTLSDISVTSNDGDLPSEHDVGGTLDTVDEGLPASVEVVELGLGDCGREASA
jgi:hypothetical protein